MDHKRMSAARQRKCIWLLSCLTSVIFCLKYHEPGDFLWPAVCRACCCCWIRDFLAFLREWREDFWKKGFVLLCRPLLNPYLGLVTERFEAFEALLPLSTQLILWLSDGIKKRLSSHSVPVHNAIFLAKFKWCFLFFSSFFPFLPLPLHGWYFDGFWYSLCPLLA